ncbi:GNAT family N-acetyltransferase [Streptomyces sp. AM 4-1-1]|uniref:GNAT family N-acetyltransferase n=1 Tax=Streptomyces sp. AM 4-1-1 TaxID=3028710 RepID=UPI0023B9D15D|nr:GNAT family N-acetyltransferase [Streptomyces sp. AM 4-1-1]WEH35883.1 GNAT family N-acetyltransferase [Streptomyces sp. AM 4-1-1]
MATAPPRLVVQPPPATGRAVPRPVRHAREEDAPALYALSLLFMRSGALRERPPALYAADVADFLVLEAPDGTLEGCLGLRVHEADTYPRGGPGADAGAGAPGATGVLYNFCVSPRSQGRGVGGLLLGAALTEATAHGLEALFTATTGDGALFLHHGFAVTGTDRAPDAWTRALDPRRGSRILSRTL